MSSPALPARPWSASPHYIASAAGLRVLEDGGSAVDAAVAINAALGVVYPHMTGPGGDAFWLIYDAAGRRVQALNGSGRAARAATRELFRSRGHQTIPPRGALSAVTVPGAVDSWCAAHSRFGRLPLARVLEPAIAHARDGYPMCGGQAACLRQVADVLATYAPAWEALDGPAPDVGREVRLPRLAATLEQIAEYGRDGFYTGAVAEEITRAVQRAGGVLAVEDLAEHRSEWTEPLRTMYRGVECYQHPPNSQGFAHLMLLNVLEGFDLAAMGDGSAGYVHTVAEATKLVFADRDRYLTDPEFSPVPLDDLLSKEYAAELRSRIGGASWVLAASATSLIALYLTYGLLGGVGTGIVYVGVIGLVVGWFPDRRGLAVGLAASGYGFGAFLTTVPIAAMVDAGDYQQALITFGLVQGLVGLLVAQGLRKPPRDAGIDLALVASGRQSQRSYTPREMLRTHPYWLLLVMMAMMSTGGLMVAAQVEVFARDFGVDGYQVLGIGAVALSLSLSRITNGLMRPFFGWVSDRIGREQTRLIAFTLEGVAVLSVLAFRENPVLFVILTGVVFFGWGEIFSLFPATLTDIYGPAHATTNYGFLYVAQGVGAILGGPAAAHTLASRFRVLRGTGGGRRAGRLAMVPAG